MKYNYSNKHMAPRGTTVKVDNPDITSWALAGWTVIAQSLCWALMVKK